MWLHISLTAFLTWINKQQTFFWWQPHTPVELNNNKSKGLRFPLMALQENYFPSALWTLNPLLPIKQVSLWKASYAKPLCLQPYRFSSQDLTTFQSLQFYHASLSTLIKKNSCGLLLWLPWCYAWHLSPKLSLCTLLWTAQNLLRILHPSLSAWFSCSFEVTPENS